MIVVSNLTKSYGAASVVSNVSFQITPGGVTSIIGPNGAGKSTLLGLISRLIPATAGTVTVNDLNIARAPSDELARRLSILRQDNHMTARLTVRDLVAFGRFPHSKGRLTADDQQRITQSISYMGLDALSDRFLDEMSGGQRQRAFVAMSLCQDTDYVLLDEPLNNLDMPHATSMMKLIRRIADDHGKTFILVLHDINYASIYSDDIIAMRDGEIVHHGPPSDILQTPVLHDIFGVDIGVHDIAGKKFGLYHV